MAAEDGGGAADAAAALVAKGFGSVAVLEGGYAAWTRVGWVLLRLAVALGAAAAAFGGGAHRSGRGRRAARSLGRRRPLQAARRAVGIPARSAARRRCRLPQCPACPTAVYPPQIWSPSGKRRPPAGVMVFSDLLAPAAALLEGMPWVATATAHPPTEATVAPKRGSQTLVPNPPKLPNLRALNPCAHHRRPLGADGQRGPQGRHKPGRCAAGGEGLGVQGLWVGLWPTPLEEHK